MTDHLSPPSYANGFARCAAESAYPELWSGIIGAWVPALGNTQNKGIENFGPYGLRNSAQTGSPTWVMNQYGPAKYYGTGAYDTLGVMPAISVGWMLLLAKIPADIGFAVFGQYYGEGFSLWSGGNPRLLFAGGIAADSGITVTGTEGCIPYFATWDRVTASIGWKGYAAGVYRQFITASSAGSFAGAAAMRLGTNEAAVNASFSLAMIGSGKLSQQLIDDPLAPFRAFRRKWWPVVAGGTLAASSRRLRLICSGY